MEYQYKVLLAPPSGHLLVDNVRKCWEDELNKYGKDGFKVISIDRDIYILIKESPKYLGDIINPT